MNKINIPAAVSATVKTILFVGAVTSAILLGVFYTAWFVGLLLSAVCLFLIVCFWEAQYTNAKYKNPS